MGQEELLDNKVNVLNEEISFNVEIDSSCAQDFPQIEEGDMETKKERGAFLFGRWVAGNGIVDIKIEGIFDAPEYIIPNPEGNELWTDFVGASEAFNTMKKESDDTKDLVFVGDIHTHPYKEDELGRKAWTYSSHDMKAWTDLYRNSDISENNPFVFGIVTQDDGTRKQRLVLYRVIKKENNELEVITINNWNWN